MRQKLLVACEGGTVMGRSAGLIGPDWPLVLLAGTPDVLELRDALGPEDFADLLCRSSEPPDAGGVWVGECDVDEEDDVSDLAWRAPTQAELTLLAARRESPEACAASEAHRWLVDGRA